MIRIGWGVIGACGIALRRMIPEGIIPARQAVLRAVMDIDEERVRQVGERFAVRRFTEVEPLLAYPEVQAVYIATPTIHHAPQALAAIEAGKHVLIEKPLAMTADEGAAIAEAARSKGVVAGVGFMMRHHGAHRRIKELIDDGTLGTPVMGRAQLSCWYPPIEGAWRQDPALGGGGAFIDMGNHCFDLLEMFFGRTTEVHAFTANRVHPYPSEDTALATFRFQSGALGIVDTLFNVPDDASKNVLEIYGTRGAIRCKGTIGQGPGGSARLIALEQKGYAAQQDRGPARATRLRCGQVNTYLAEIRDFSDAIALGHPPTCSIEDGVWNMKVVEAAYRSARTGCAVKLTEE